MFVGNREQKDKFCSSQDSRHDPNLSLQLKLGFWFLDQSDLVMFSNKTIPSIGCEWLTEPWDKIK